MRDVSVGWWMRCVAVGCWMRGVAVGWWIRGVGVGWWMRGGVEPAWLQCAGSRRFSTVSLKVFTEKRWKESEQTKDS